MQTRIQKLSSTETSLFTKHETKQFEFQVPVSYNRGIEKIKYQILNYIHCMKMIRNTINL